MTMYVNPFVAGVLTVVVVEIVAVLVGGIVMSWKNRR